MEDRTSSGTVGTVLQRVLSSSISLELNWNCFKVSVRTWNCSGGFGTVFRKNSSILKINTDEK